MTAPPKSRRTTREALDLSRDAGEVRERIRSAAVRLFGQRGYAAVSVRRICAGAGTSAPMVYYYFGSKRGLYESILKESVAEERAQLRAAIRFRGDGLTRLHHILEARLGIGAEPAVQELRLFFLRELFGLGSDLYLSGMERTDRAFRHAVKDAIQQGIDEGVLRPVAAEKVALSVLGIIGTFLRRVALGAPLRLEDALEQVMDTMVYGLLAPGAETASG